METRFFPELPVPSGVENPSCVPCNFDGAVGSKQGGNRDGGGLRITWVKGVEQIACRFDLEMEAEGGTTG